VLLIGYFHDRPAPVRNSFRVWVIYRASDAALLLAAIFTHRLVGEGDFHHLMGTGAWPDEVTTVTAAQAGLIGGLLLFAAAGKSALLPFCGWLPRAMEGPTPSSAVFYGALSVHLGAFLLLRVSSLFACSLVLAVATVALGLGTAAYATFVGRVQTDIKSALSFASLIQVGIIVAEIGAGHWVPFLWYVALVHLLGHACLRTLQFVRAPSLLLDYRSVENAIGGKLPRPSGQTPSRFRLWLYRFALDRGELDAVLTDFIARPSCCCSAPSPGGRRGGPTGSTAVPARPRPPWEWGQQGERRCPPSRNSTPFRQMTTRPTWRPADDRLPGALVRIGRRRPPAIRRTGLADAAPGASGPLGRCRLRDLVRLRVRRLARAVPRHHRRSRPVVPH
jgi:hypothetical protein